MDANIVDIRKDTWWNRRCGGSDVLRQAIPLIISSGSISLMNFTDRMFLMWFNTDAMSASMYAGITFWSAVAIPSAVAMFTTTFVAQYYGSRNDHRIGAIVWQGIWIGFLMMPVLLLAGPYLAGLFETFGHAPEVVVFEKAYLGIMLWGGTATIGGEAAAAFFRGRGRMHVEMYVNIFCVFLNVALDYCMIFGEFGFPEWGLEGAALATVISQWVRFLIYIGLMFLTDRVEKRFKVWAGMRLDFPLLGRLLYFGTPSSSYSFVDTFTFALFLMIIGGLGKLEGNATALAFTMNSFTFIPLVGIGIVVTSMVGNQLGDNRPDLARRATNTATVIGCIYTGIFGVLFLAVPHLLLLAFSVFSDPAEFAEIRDLSVVLLRFIALYLFFDSCSIIFSSALRGAGDTIYVMRIVLVLAPMLPLFCYVGVKYFDLGIIWCWIVLTADVFAYCICFSLRFFGGKWEKMRVIEKELQKKETGM